MLFTYNKENGYSDPGSAIEASLFLQDIRKKSLKTYLDAEMPSRVKHLWRYTRPEDFLSEEEINSVVIDRSYLEPAIDKMSSKWNNQIDFLSIEELHDQGVIFSRLDEASITLRPIVEDHLGKLVDKDFGKFESFNLAKWSRGYFLYIPPGKSIEKPIYIGNRESSGLSVERLLIIVDKNSSVSFVDDTFQNKENFIDDLMINRVTEIFIKENSKVQQLNLQRLGEEALFYHTERIQLDSGSTLNKSIIGTGGVVSKANIGVILGGESANSKINGIVIGGDEQSFDHHIFHHHTASKTHSDIKFRTVVDDESISSNTGLIRIEKDAAGCEAFQENRNLMRSPFAKVNSIPELEIINDDVSCSHGVTMGNIDPEMVYYLNSRGIDNESAEQMIVEGFLNSLVAEIPESFQKIAKLALNRNGEEENAQGIPQSL
jgi:Fe-S cluster assembly protein SufD